jgi:hypothetical protein
MNKCSSIKFKGRKRGEGFIAVFRIKLPKDLSLKSGEEQFFPVPLISAIERGVIFIIFIYQPFPPPPPPPPKPLYKCISRGTGDGLHLNIYS